MTALEQATDVNAVALALRESPYQDVLPLGRTLGRTPSEALESPVTRSLADRMASLTRWAGPDGRALAPLFIEQDAANVRDILRGLVGALTPDERTASVIPTPYLGRKRLAVLARLESPAEVAAKLVAWRHPLGSALVEEASASRTDLFRLETALARRAAAVASRAARRGGRRMREFVRESIDARNAVTALLLAGARAEGQAAEYFVDGGDLPLAALVRAAAAGDAAGAVDLLEKASRGTSLAPAFREAPTSPAALSDRILRRRIAVYTKRARQEPLTAIPVLLFVLRLRREARAVRRALWAASLGGGGPS
jgi:V/A-type H+-transporting ATPase subunit C